ncbi:MAG: hypothetical protein EBU88_15310 [Acidobacteria bacterium]|nr:hypothetical protein [Acidobacteriota bacterium]
MDWTDFREQWNTYRYALQQDPAIGVLKAFRDRLICDLAFNRAFIEDPKKILECEYGVLALSDITIFLTQQQQQEKFGACVESSERAKLLRRTLNIDQLLRDQIKRLHPVHAGWDVWRQLQITRYQKEDPSPRGVQITHIPFAIELTQGCSGACSRR